MTMTIKLDPEQERAIRQRSVALGLPASAVIREALAAWLEANADLERSAFELGKDLFGRHEGPGDLSEDRRSIYADIAAERQASRGSPDDDPTAT